MSKGIEIIVIAVFIISVIAGPFSISTSANSNNLANTTSTENTPLSEKYGLLEDSNKGYEYYSSDSNTYIGSDEVSGGHAYYLQDSGRYGSYNDVESGYNYYAQDTDEYGNYNDSTTGYGYYLQDNKRYPIEEDYYQYN
jgi:hypothetical protein